MANLKLGIDTRGVLAGQRTFNNSLNNIKNNVGGFGTEVSKTTLLLKRMSTALGVAVVGAVGTSVKLFKDFDQEMRRVNSVVGGTSETFQELSKIAREVGATTNFTALQAAKGLYNFASAGFVVAEQASALRETLLFAGAAAIDLDKATDIVSTTLRQFKIEAGNTSRATNVMASAIATSRASADRLQESLRYVGPVAGSLNIELEETVAVLAQLFNAGLEGSMAGTTLRNAMIKLINPVGRGTKVLKELGLTTDDINIKTKGLIEVFETLRQAKITEAQASQLFGQQGVNIIRIINQGSEALNDYKDSITDTNKTQEMYAEQTDTLIGDVDILMSATQELALKLGEDLNPATRTATQELTGLVGQLNYTYEAMRKTGDGANFVATVATSAGINLLKFFEEALYNFEPSITKFQNGLELALLGVTSLTSMVFRIIESNSKNTFNIVKNFGIEILNFLANQIEGVLNLYQSGFDMLPDWLKPEWYQNLLDSSKAFTDNLRGGLGEKQETRGIKDQFNEIKKIVEEVGEVTRVTFDELFTNQSGSTTQGIISNINDLIKYIEEIEVSLFYDTFEGYESSVEKAKEKTDDFADNTAENVKKMKSCYGSLGEDIKNIFTESAEGFSQAFADSIMGTKNAFDDFFKGVLNQLLQLQIQQQITTPLFSALGLTSKTTSGETTEIPGFASGGVTPINRPFIVGERGPEIMQLNKSATVTPNHKIGGETNVTVINNSPAQARVEESDNSSGGKDITIVIDEMVAGKIAQGGKTQKAISSVFGINPKGY